MKSKLFIAILLISVVLIVMNSNSLKPKLDKALRYLQALSTTYLHTTRFTGGEENGPLTAAGCWSASITDEANQDYDKALDQVNAYQQQGGDKFLATQRSGWLCYLKKDYPPASAFYARANQMQPAALNPLLGLLDVAQAQKDTSRIQDAAAAVLRVQPSNYRAQMALAGVYYAKKDYRSAISIYRLVLIYYPEDIDAASGDAWCSYFLADPQRAFREFSRILSVNSEYPYAQQGYDLTSGKTYNGDLPSPSVQPASGLRPANGL